MTQQKYKIVPIDNNMVRANVMCKLDSSATNMDFIDATIDEIKAMLASCPDVSSEQKLAIGSQVKFYQKHPESPKSNEPTFGIVESFYDWKTAECGEYYTIKMAVVNVDGLKMEVEKTCLMPMNTKPLPCSSCNDTGDIHKADGEYLGKCTCNPAPVDSEPVAWRLHRDSTTFVTGFAGDFDISTLPDNTNLYTAPQPNRVAELEAKLKECEADANRYRWLREQNANLDSDSFVVLAHDCTAEDQWQKYWAGSYLDKAIDDAKLLAEMKGK